MANMDFKNFDDSAKQKILSLQNQDESIYKNYFASDITVQMFFSWIDCDKPQYIDCDDFLLVKKNTEKNGFFFAPVASTPQNFKKGLTDGSSDCKISVNYCRILRYRTGKEGISEI